MLSEICLFCCLPVHLSGPYEELSCSKVQSNPTHLSSSRDTSLCLGEWLEQRDMDGDNKRLTSGKHTKPVLLFWSVPGWSNRTVWILLSVYDYVGLYVCFWITTETQRL